MSRSSTDIAIECSVTEAASLVRRGAVLVDVRDANERHAGWPAGAQHVPGHELDQALSGLVRGAEQVLLVCAMGQRSLRMAAVMRDAGYATVRSVQGGYAAWRAAGLPCAREDGALDARASERYARHLQLPQVGLQGQKKLLDARVLVIGAGGLGSSALFYLAAAGIGTLGVVDDDRVDRSNLQRQILHTDDRVGMAKIESAAQTLRALNPDVRVVTHAMRLDESNVDELVGAYDLVVDGSDNLRTRYLLSDACVRLGKPWVHAAVHQFDGQVTVFAAGVRPGESPCYRCLFPDPPGEDAMPNCAEAGVLGVLPGIMGLLQATEAVKWLLRLGDSLDGRLLCFDALSMRFREIRLRPDPKCPACGDGEAAMTLPGASCSATDTPNA